MKLFKNVVVFCVKSRSSEDEKHFISNCEYEKIEFLFFHSVNLVKNLDETVNLNIIMEKKSITNCQIS